MMHTDRTFCYRTDPGIKNRLSWQQEPSSSSDEVLIALSMSAATDETAKKALAQLPKLRGCQVHTSVMLSNVDTRFLRNWVFS